MNGALPLLHHVPSWRGQGQLYFYHGLKIKEALTLNGRVTTDGVVTTVRARPTDRRLIPGMGKKFFCSPDSRDRL